ncbi:MAG: CYTH domain-containing protein [Flavobacteriia bacterium]|nr:CYTH domain-containing protein [Flavobacteriia bacterium]
MIEIERKFLVKNVDFLTEQDAGFNIQQAYIMESNDRSLRVRIKNERAFLTLKIGKNALERLEFEYEISLVEAQAMLQCCSRVLHKKRFKVWHQNVRWEVDVFQGDLLGLYLAEVELESLDQNIDLPDWVGEEVTHDPQYLNVNLIKRLEVR